MVTYQDLGIALDYNRGFPPSSIRHTLAQARPDAFLPDLAAALNNLARMLAALGRDAGADAVRGEVATITGRS